MEKKRSATTKEARPLTSKKTNENILVKGARVHNLKNVTVEFPRNKFIVVTGVSGSGKSSLTIDTLFAEGQRRYAESLSAYARQFMARMNKPDVDYIKGLCPAIAIEQKVSTRTPRSTVGSMTEIYDYLRLLYARAGHNISPVSGREVKKDDVKDVIETIQKLPAGSKVLILAVFKQHANRQSKEELNILLQKGFSRMYVNDEMIRIEDLLELTDEALEEKIKHQEPETRNPKPKTSLNQHLSTFILVDRIISKAFDEDDIHRMSDSVGVAFYEGEGEMYLQVDGEKLIHFSNKFELDGIQFEEPVPNLFSFNNPFGACPTCEGFGQVLGIDADLVIPDKRLSVYEGAVAPWKGEKMGLWKDNFVRVARQFDFPVHTPVADLTKEQSDILWKGNKYANGINDFFKEVEQNLYKVQYRVMLSRYRGRTVCPECEGYRLRKEALYIKVDGLHIGEVCQKPVKDLYEWFSNLQLSDYDRQVAKRILLEIDHRLRTLLDVGLGYLTLNRLANSLSGGESQRIRLATQIGSQLQGITYILDEPSIGLHQRDNQQLIYALKNLRDIGNSVLVVEHDKDIMLASDHLIDIGPRAGKHGGQVVAQGIPKQVLESKSETSKFLRGERSIEVPKQRRAGNGKLLELKGVKGNNLKGVNVKFPLGKFICVTGVSGSGKSTLITETLYPILSKHAFNSKMTPMEYKSVTGLEHIDKVIEIDQSPIGRTPRSNPATYCGFFTEIRTLFSVIPEAKIRGYAAGRFSFNVKGGRCDVCEGGGMRVIEMNFLPDVYVPCEKCNGRRYNRETLEIRYKGKSISDVLDMTVDEAVDFFQNIHYLYRKIKVLQDVGLGYITLGQSAVTLSGGEAQRVKLATELAKKDTGKTFYILDEPTTGLHFQDIQHLLDVLNKLVDRGNTVLVIEHNLDVIKVADHIIDLGPEGGGGGGKILFEGTPENLVKVKGSHTGKYLTLELHGA